MESKKRITQILLGIFAFAIGALFIKNYLFKSPSVPKAIISFSPSEATASPETDVKVMVDANTNKLAYGRIEVDFDPNALELRSDIEPSPRLATVIELTLRDEANASGKLIMTLGLKPGEEPVSGSFEFATLAFKAKGEKKDSKVTIQSSEVQLVNMDAQVIPFDAKEAFIKNISP